MGRILVTGATGFVGRRVTARLAERGDPVTIAVRRSRAGDLGRAITNGSRTLDAGTLSPAGRGQREGDPPSAQKSAPPRPVGAADSTSPRRGEGFARSDVMGDRAWYHGGDIRVVEVGEIGSDTDWADALREVSTVIHLAAHVHVAPERAASEADIFERVNHLGTLRLYRQASDAGVGLFVFASSITVLGGASAPGQPFDDGSVMMPETPYGRSKRDAERSLAASLGAPLVVLRPPLIAGPGVGGNLRTLARLAALPVPLPFGAIRNRRTLLSLDNLASAIEAVIARPIPGHYVLGDHAPLSTAEIIAALRRGVGRPPGLISVPPGLLAGAARVVGRGGDAQRLLGDLEVDSSRFRALYDWSDEVGTAEVLEAVGRAAARTAVASPSL